MQQFTADAGRTTWRTTGQDHREFITAQPRHHVRIAHAMAQHAGHRPQHGIAGQMAPGVVDRLEAVQIDVHQRGGLAGALDAGDRLLQVHLEAAAVAQLGQRVDLGQVAGFALARTLAGEWGPKKVRINCIAPGLVKTDFARALWEDQELLTRRTATTPLRRIGESHEIAGAVAYLGSDASTFMTGQTIVIDGGVTTAAV